jgi:mono/diheme cytochrome c family protein
MRRIVLGLFLCGAFFVCPLVSFSQVDSEAVKRGSYLVNQVSKCADCHTPRTAGRLDKTKWLKGSTLEFGPLAPVPGWAKAAPDLTLTGPLWKNWREDALVQFFLKGAGPDGKPAAPPMPAFTLTSQDAHAIVQYLKSLP